MFYPKSHKFSFQKGDNSIKNVLKERRQSLGVRTENTSSSLPKTRQLQQRIQKTWQLQQRIQVLLVSALGWYDFLFTYLFCLFGCFVENFYFWSCFSNIRGEQCSQMFWTTTVQCKSKSVQIQVITFFCTDTCQGFLPVVPLLLKGKVWF